MASLNKVQLIGNVGQDLELRHTQNGKAVTNFTLATTTSRTDGQGNKQDDTEWHRIVVWEKLAENCAQYLAKGKRVYVEGRIASRKYQDKEGVERMAYDIVAHSVLFLSPADQGQGQDNYDPQAKQYDNRQGNNRQNNNRSQPPSRGPIPNNRGQQQGRQQQPANDWAGGQNLDDIPF